MKARKEQVLERCKALPCIRPDRDGNVTIVFQSQIYASRERFENDPLLVLREATAKLMADVERACRTKFQVLNEIEEGTNRYRIEHGNFVGVGKGDAE